MTGFLPLPSSLSFLFENIFAPASTPSASAMASSTVDLPEPLLPVMKLTRSERCSSMCLCVRRLIILTRSMTPAYNASGRCDEEGGRWAWRRIGQRAST